jgi:hypothetical protein
MVAKSFNYSNCLPIIVAFNAEIGCFSFNSYEDSITYEGMQALSHSFKFKVFIDNSTPSFKVSSLTSIEILADSYDYFIVSSIE